MNATVAVLRCVALALGEKRRFIDRQTRKPRGVGMEVSSKNVEVFGIKSTLRMFFVFLFGVGGSSRWKIVLHEGLEKTCPRFFYLFFGGGDFR